MENRKPVVLEGTVAFKDDTVTFAGKSFCEILNKSLKLTLKDFTEQRYCKKRFRITISVEELDER